MLGRNMIKFCSGDFSPESVPSDSQHLDPLLATASKSPPAQVSAQGLDGTFPCKLLPFLNKSHICLQGPVECQQFLFLSHHAACCRPGFMWPFSHIHVTRYPSSESGLVPGRIGDEKFLPAGPCSWFKEQSYLCHCRLPATAGGVCWQRVFCFLAYIVPISKIGRLPSWAEITNGSWASSLCLTSVFSP